MKRRAFIGTTGAAVVTGAAGCRIEDVRNSGISAKAVDNGKLAGYKLEELRELYRYDLFDDFLPFMEKYVIDHEYGGFMCNTDRDGTNITKNKRTWYEGRGIWVYSFLYNNLDKNPKYLEAARKSVEFILPHIPVDGKLMPSEFTRVGEPIGGPDPIFYGDMFIANGLQEYSQTEGNGQYWDTAKEILLKCIDIYDNRPGYGTMAATDNLPGVKEPRILGHWMVLLRISIQMLEKRTDTAIEEIADRCIDTLMNYHLNPEFNLMNEYVNHNLSRIDNDLNQYILGHGPETLWMIISRAIQAKDRALYDRAAELFKRHIEVMWDDVYDGLFVGITNVNNNTCDVNKALWLQEEILVGTLMVAEHTGDQWAKDWFSQMYTYVRDKFPLKQYGYPIWILYADRKVTFEPKANRVGNFHHPRHLMMNLLSLDRMIERGGNVSDLFA